MTNEMEDKEKLLKTIRDKRNQIELYLQQLEPHGSRLTNLSIGFGAIATLLTASQLPFGRGSVNLLQSTHFASGVSVWQLLAVVATICSAIAAVAGALYKQQEIASRLAKAQSCSVKLESLETSLDLGQLNLKEANLRYGQSIVEIPFVRPSVARSSLRRNYPLDLVKGQITTPQAGQSVSRAFHCSGSVSDVGSGIHLWLAIEVNGLVWPKEGQLFFDESGAWTTTIFEDGATDLFSLSMFAANRSGHKNIERWLTSGKRSGLYKELTSLPGTRRVTRVDGLRLSNTST